MSMKLQCICLWARRFGGLCTLLALSSSAHAQHTPPAIVWQDSAVGGLGSEGVSSIVRTFDGGYAAVGNMGLYAPNGHGGSDGFVTKLNRDGKIEWQKIYG